MEFIRQSHQNGLGKLTDPESTGKECKISRSHRLKNYREARKAKTICTHTDDPLNNQNLPGLGQKLSSREEKMQIQKLRNRDAAQRARDKAKAHLTILQKEVMDLKNEIKVLREVKNLCYKCGDSIIIPEEPQKVSEVAEEDYSFFGKDSSIEVEPFFEYERSRSSNSFNFPLLLTILTISVCLMAGTPGNSNSHSEIQTKRPLRILSEMLKFEDSGNKTTRIRIQPIKQILQQMNITAVTVFSPPPLKKCSAKHYIDCNQTCYISNTTQVCVGRFSNQTNTNSTFKANLQAVQLRNVSHDVLFCELPRIYRYRSKHKKQMQDQVNSLGRQGKLLEGQFSLMIDAKNMKHIRMRPEGLVMQNQDDQGLYEVHVEVVSVSKVNRSTCVLGYKQY